MIKTRILSLVLVLLLSLSLEQTATAGLKTVGKKIGKGVKTAAGKVTDYSLGIIVISYVIGRGVLFKINPERFPFPIFHCRKCARLFENIRLNRYPTTPELWQMAFDVRDKHNRVFGRKAELTQTEARIEELAKANPSDPRIGNLNRHMLVIREHLSEDEVQWEKSREALLGSIHTDHTYTRLVITRHHKGIIDNVLDTGQAFDFDRANFNWIVRVVLEEELHKEIQDRREFLGRHPHLIEERNWWDWRKGKFAPSGANGEGSVVQPGEIDTAPLQKRIEVGRGIPAKQ